MGGMEGMTARRQGKSVYQAQLGAAMHLKGKKVLFVTPRPGRTIQLLAKLLPSAWFSITDGHEVRVIDKVRHGSSSETQE